VPEPAVWQLIAAAIFGSWMRNCNQRAKKRRR
jgi:hypothetical protein